MGAGPVGVGAEPRAVQTSGACSSRRGGAARSAERGEGRGCGAERGSRGSHGEDQLPAGRGWHQGRQGVGRGGGPGAGFGRRDPADARQGGAAFSPPSQEGGLGGRRVLPVHGHGRAAHGPRLRLRLHLQILLPCPAGPRQLLPLRRAVRGLAVRPDPDAQGAGGGREDLPGGELRAHQCPCAPVWWGRPGRHHPRLPAGPHRLPRHLPGQVLRHRAQHLHRAAPPELLGAAHECEEGDLPPADVHHPGGDGGDRARQRQGGPGLLHLPPVQWEGHLPAAPPGLPQADQQARGQELQRHPPLREHLRGGDAHLWGGVRPPPAGPAPAPFSLPLTALWSSPLPSLSLYLGHLGIDPHAPPFLPAPHASPRQGPRRPGLPG